MRLVQSLCLMLSICFSYNAYSIQSETALPKEAIFYSAVKTGQTEEVRSLLAEGLDVNQPFGEGISALHLAVINNQEEVAEILIQSGANVNAPDATLSATPLHLAALYGRNNIANALIKRGANVNALMKFNISPLLVAAQFKQAEMIELLLNNKANLHHSDQDGYSALHFAAQNGDDITAKILLDRGAQVNMRDKTKNATPIMVAREQNHMNVVKLLEEQGS